MKRKNSRGNIITIIGSVLVLIGVIVSIFIRDVNKIITMITTITAVIGAFAIYIQIRKSKLIGQSSFTIELLKYFYEIPELAQMVRKMGKELDINNRSYVFKKTDLPILIKYLNYMKTICSLVEGKVVTIETLNNFLAYEFFVVVNNKSAQKLEIRPFAHCYHDIFVLYDKWSRYRKKHNHTILSEEQSLDMLIEYQEFFKGRNV